RRPRADWRLDPEESHSSRPEQSLSQESLSQLLLLSHAGYVFPALPVLPEPRAGYLRVTTRVGSTRTTVYVRSSSTSGNQCGVPAGMMTISPFAIRRRTPPSIAVPLNPGPLICVTTSDAPARLCGLISVPPVTSRPAPSSTWYTSLTLSCDAPPGRFVPLGRCTWPTPMLCPPASTVRIGVSTVFDAIASLRVA